MFPPSQGINLDIEAISGICGSVSIACWVVVFSPQIIENFRRGSADGLSLHFIIVWLLGDVFNILGAVLQGVLPTMIILAVYYTIADLVLLAQCFYYRGFTLKDEAIPPPKPQGEPSERTSLLPPNGNGTSTHSPSRERRLSTYVDPSHLNPALPMRDSSQTREQAPPAPTSTLQAFLFNLVAVLMVVAAGIFGWWISNRKSQHAPPHTPEHTPPDHGEDAVVFSLWGQIFGYLCAVLYLGSRIPQMLLNYRRKSTEGVSMLFFLFACIGNLTYVLSIFAFEAKCHGKHGKCRKGEWSEEYWRYVAVNASWIAGSLGTLLLDMAIFVQFFVYRENGKGKGKQRAEERVEYGGDERPILERGDSDYGAANGHH